MAERIQAADALVSAYDLRDAPCVGCARKLILHFSNVPLHALSYTIYATASAHLQTQASLCSRRFRTLTYTCLLRYRKTHERPKPGKNRLILRSINRALLARKAFRLILRPTKVLLVRKSLIHVPVTHSLRLSARVPLCTGTRRKVSNNSLQPKQAPPSAKDSGGNSGELDCKLDADIHARA